MRVLIWIFLFASALEAHPGVGIVMDARGRVYYTDLKQVWRIERNGTRAVAVPGVHTHELCLDGDGNLYGEHVWYEGDATKRWGHRVWRLSPAGQVEDVIPAREGFLQGYSFVRDGSGTHYWAERGPSTVIRKRLPDGTLQDHARAPFTDVRWLTVTPSGLLFLVDGSDLKRIHPSGEVVTLARELQPRRLRRLYLYDRHALMGLWTDRAGQVYVAAYGDREIRRVDPQGRVKVVARSNFPWGPTGGLVAPDGSLWILEWAQPWSARVRRISPEGAVSTYP